MPEFFTLASPQDAVARLLSHIHPLQDRERIEVRAADRRVLAAEIRAPHPLPEFRRSTLDGYAVHARDTFGASEALPAYLDLTGEVPMGQMASFSLEPGTAALVHTGGHVPEGADAVVMLEHTQRSAPGEIEVLRPAAPGDGLIEVGEDVQKNTVVFQRGHILRPADIGGLLALGITQVEVTRRPRVAIFATGDEVIPPEAQTLPGQVRDLNSAVIALLAERAGAVALPQGILPDDFETIRDRVDTARDQGADMVVLSAGSSVSARDLTARVFNDLGKPGVLVHGIATRPGKPTILAVAGGCPLIGLPGNPVSAYVQFVMVGLPPIYRLQGAQAPRSAVLQARLTTNVASAAGREDYLPARFRERDGTLWVEPVFFKSNLIFTLAAADGLLRIPLDSTGLQAGAQAEVLIL